jgi:hypothetical protein
VEKRNGQQQPKQTNVPSKRAKESRHDGRGLQRPGTILCLIMSWLRRSVLMLPVFRRLDVNEVTFVSVGLKNGGYVLCDTERQRDREKLCKSNLALIETKQNAKPQNSCREIYATG